MKNFIVLGHPLISSFRAKVFGSFREREDASKFREGLLLNREDIYFYTIEEVDLI